MHIGIIGVGAVGAYLGLRLAAAGTRVTMVGRPSVVERRGDLKAISRAGDLVSAGNRTEVTDEPARLACCDLCLVTVKSRDTVAVAELLRDILPRKIAVLSLQNGLRNRERLCVYLPHRVLCGVLGFNVAWRNQTTVEQLVNGWVFLQHDLATLPLVRRFKDALHRGGERAQIRDDIDDVAAGRLLINLNQGVCAAIGLGIREVLADHDGRWCLSACMREGRNVLGAAGFHPVRVAAVGPRTMAWALRLPNSVVSWAADASGISGNSFAGTLQDLHRGRHTEVHELNGEIVALAQRYGHEAPANRIVLNVVRRHESNVIARRKPQFLSPRQLRGLIERAQLNTERPRASSYQATVELGV